ITIGFVPSGDRTAASSLGWIVGRSAAMAAASTTARASMKFRMDLLYRGLRSHSHACEWRAQFAAGCPHVLIGLGLVWTVLFALRGRVLPPQLRSADSAPPPHRTTLRRRRKLP